MQLKNWMKTNPSLSACSDIPGHYSGEYPLYPESLLFEGEDAFSVWVPARLVKSCRGGMPYREQIHGIEACPAGVNILRGDKISKVQSEFAILMDDPGLALNVNTRADLAAAEIFLKNGLL